MTKILTMTLATLAIVPALAACTATSEPTPGGGAGSTTPAPAATEDPATTDPTTDPGGDPVKPAAPTTPDGCLDGQDLEAADVDITSCPTLPSAPQDAIVGGKHVNLGAWEMGTTPSGKNYQYGTLSGPETTPRTLKYDGGEEAVNEENVRCWAKGYYRLRKILLNPPAEWVALKDAGFQYRFFQFQTDLRNGPTGYKTISSFEDHLVKWVTVVDKTGACQQPTPSKFKAYATSELKRRGLPVPQ